MDDFPDRLREARSKAGLTQQELAAVIDVSKPTMSLYESGKMMPRDTKLHALADALGVSFSWLKNGTGEDEDLPDELKEKLIESARASGRSLNAEIIHRLEQSFFASSEAGELMRIADSFSKEGAIIKGVADHLRTSLCEITKVLDEMEQKADGYEKLSSDHETLAHNKASRRREAE